MRDVSAAARREGVAGDIDLWMAQRWRELGQGIDGAQLRLADPEAAQEIIGVEPGAAVDLSSPK